MTYAIAAAGTGGHVFPALAVAAELASRSTEQIVFLGGDRLEATAVPSAGFELVQFRLAGLKRSLSPANLRMPAIVWKAAGQMAAELEKRRVMALAAFGGYVTVPAALAARKAGVPLVIHEQNARPGLANRLAARRAARVLCAFPAAALVLRRAEVVGNPLRPEFRNFDRSALRPSALSRYGLSHQRPVVGIVGGSLGALSLNNAAAAFAASRGPKGPAIVHLAGPEHAERLQRRASGASLPWTVVSFEDSMPHFYAASDLVVCRAGAITISELSATATPAVLVPLSAVAQEGNAAFLADAGAARLLPQNELDRLERLLTTLIGDQEALRHMAGRARALAKPRAAAAVADAMEAAVG